MRVLITGVAGHLGAALARRLCATVDVVGIDNLSTGFAENVPAGVNWFKTDVFDVPVVWNEDESKYYGRDPWPWVWTKYYDVVYHFAAFAAEVLSPKVRRHTCRNVFEATCAVINGCQRQGCGRLVLASSIAVYGEGSNPHDESDVCNPVDTYGNCKLACEREVQNSGLDYCIVRPHNVYGPGQNIWDDSRNVFGIWMRQRLEGRPLRIFGDGTQRRAFTYIDDILEPLWLAGTLPEAAGEIINLGGSVPTSINDAAGVAMPIIGASEIEYLPARREVKDSWATTEKSQRLLGYRDETPLDAGIAKMWGASQVAWNGHPERNRRYSPSPEC
jgi:UDP-glucose 4-epimerase